MATQAVHWVAKRTALDRISACGVWQGREAYGSGVHVYVDDVAQVTCTDCLSKLDSESKKQRARIVAKRVLQTLERELKALDGEETAAALREVKDDVEAHLLELAVRAA